MKHLLIDIENPTNIKLGSTFENFIQRHNRAKQAGIIDMSQDDCENKHFASTQFAQIQKKQLFDLQKSLERYCNVSRVFAFNSAESDPNLLKSPLLPILVIE